ncbi:MAG: hypothetical protein PVJ57_20510 [Phycisphaerae bacterium]|jgi:endoglucanase
MPVPKLLRDLLSLPTASFAEDLVLERVRETCRALPGVTCREDRYGNLLARYRYRPRKVTPLVFTAHTDHPGFVAQEMRDKRTLRAAFRGYVESPYFAGARVCFWTANRWVRGRVVELTKEVTVHRGGRCVSRPEEVLIRVTEPVVAGAPGVWDLPAPRLQGNLIHARGHDDIAGVAALLTLLARLSRRRASADVFCLFTRAEEVGFIGAVGAMKARTVPKKLPVIVIETSKALPDARIGDGPILRVGDRLSVYAPELLAYMERVAQKLTKRRKTFAFQRKLMDGGACEATGFMAYGYRAGGICLPLGNYHNMDTDRGRIAPECISLADWQRLTDLFEALVTEEQDCGAPDRTVQADLEQRFNTHAALLAGCAPARRRRK